MCSKKGQHLLQAPQILGNEFRQRTKYWISLFRRKKFSWGEDFTKTVCVAARIQANGSYRLKSHFCNESLEALCHKPDHTNYGSSDSEVMIASLGTVLGVVVVCIIVVAAINYRRISIYKDKLKKVNERLPGTEFSTYTGIEENNEEPNNLGYSELVVSTSHRLAECHEIEMDTRDDAMDYQGYLVPEQHYRTIPETDVHYTEAYIAENNAVN
ncbi:unnamed protein product [Mytilus coruscus]|uniref:Uncharacterized protein n=1 Tax=Mytilus coruscus TaxID=42192 RepID=A0A6J8AYE6_MYTCO|nr:unnamed protein product [Mytilus coruscus]